MCVSRAMLSWKKDARQFMPSNRLQATSVLVACSCVVTTVFPDIEKSSTVKCKNLLQKL